MIITEKIYNKINGSRKAISFCPKIYIDEFVIKDKIEVFTNTFKASLYEILRELLALNNNINVKNSSDK